MSSPKTIGLIGGMSWESTVTYYRLVNETIQERLGGLHSAKLVLYSVDFHEIERLQHAEDWDAAGALLAAAARSLQAAGAARPSACLARSSRWNNPSTATDCTIGTACASSCPARTRASGPGIGKAWTHSCAREPRRRGTSGRDALRAGVSPGHAWP
jgi:hypothetical protein